MFYCLFWLTVLKGWGLFSDLISPSKDRESQFIFKYSNLRLTFGVVGNRAWWPLCPYIDINKKILYIEHPNLIQMTKKKLDLDKDEAVSFEDFSGTVRRDPTMTLEVFGPCLPSEKVKIN